jgi:hypothetical protein
MGISRLLHARGLFYEQNYDNRHLGFIFCKEFLAPHFAFEVDLRRSTKYPLTHGYPHIRSHFKFDQMESVNAAPTSTSGAFTTVGKPSRQDPYVLNDTDARLASLENALAERTQRLATIESTLDERSARLSTLERNNEERNIRLSALERTLDERNIRLSALERTLEERNIRLSALEGTMEERTNRLVTLEAYSKELEAHFRQPFWHRAASATRRLIRRR